MNDPLIATVQRTAPDLVEVRFQEGAVWTVPAINAVLQARNNVMRSGSAKVLVVLPAVLDFELATITTDHYEGQPFLESCLAEAWAVQNAFNEKLARLYFSYFPGAVPPAILYTETEARAWLAAQ